MINNSTRLKQTVIIGAVLLLVAFLFTRDIKGLIKPKEQNGAAPAMAGQQMPAAQADTKELNLEGLSTAAKNLINSSLAAEITSLEAEFKQADDANNKATVAQKLAEKWDDVEQATPSAMYLEVVAENKRTLKDWLLTGDRFLKAFESTQDSLLQPALLQKANHAYSNAAAIDSTSIDAKTGMGVTIVNGLGMPMQGIAMLLEVVKKDPNNIKANMNLGLFSIKSGQFDKAIGRFNTVIASQPSPDAYFYLATAYENLGENKEAVNAYLQSKKLAANPTLTKFIDKKVAELKNKN